MSEVFEMLMVVAFGFAWPASILKSLRAKTAEGKSLLFLLIIFTGYLCGITSKLLADNITYVFAFYIINTLMVGTDIVLYFRNLALDRRRKAETGH